MKCPFCSHDDTRVVDSRLGKEGNNIRRRRECIDCERRFTTYERVEETLPLVIKKDGREATSWRPVFPSASSAPTVSCPCRKAVRKRSMPVASVKRS